MSYTNKIRKSINFMKTAFFFLGNEFLTALILTCNLKEVIQIVKVIYKSCNVIVLL